MGLEPTCLAQHNLGVSGAWGSSRSSGETALVTPQWPLLVDLPNERAACYGEGALGEHLHF